jgi:hypothetical protein
MSIEEWLAWARANAKQRGLEGTLPVLQALAEAVARLRAEDPDATTRPITRAPGS